MTRLCFATFFELLQESLLAPNEDIFVGQLLLDPIIDTSNVLDKNKNILQVNSKMISKLKKQKSNIHKGVKEASVKKGVILAVIDTFENEIIPVLNPHSKLDFHTKLAQLIIKDDSISLHKRNELLNDNIPTADRLANIFLYAINCENKVPLNICGSPVNTVDKPITTELSSTSDLYLLMEANCTCPLCGESLVTDKIGHSLKHYEIVQIYPQLTSSKEIKSWINIKKPCEDLYSNSNKTVLCTKCAINYKTFTTVKDYYDLISRKKELLRNYNAKIQISSIMLEDQIESVLRSISTVSYNNLLEPLNYSAIRIRNKIEPCNLPLIIKTEGFVVNYYNYIRDLFAQLECEGVLSFDIISMEVKMAYTKLLKQDLTQDEIA